MTEDEIIARFGLHPTADQLPEIRDILAAETAKERAFEGDTLLLKACCVLLFNSGDSTDILRIWAAKRASFDAMCSLDVQLLCGQGLEETKTFLQNDDSDDAADALDYLVACEEAGDFEEFTVDEYAASWADYHGLGSGC